MGMTRTEVPLRYIRVRWLHDSKDDPVLLVSELDHEDFEVRKVEVFPDGRMGYAGPDGSTETTRLAVEPLPDTAEIAADPQFRVEGINAQGFEDLWRAAHSLVALR